VEEINRLNGILAEERIDPEIQTRISQYELAFKMQTSVPELTDFSNESQEMLDMYGLKQPGDGSFASNCLLARRLAERGVRFIQLYHRAWDHHGEIERDMPLAAKDVDQASAALIKDLKQRGMLEDTLVIWGGEFGRTPMGQGSGRDHHINAFSIWMAGGGIKPGLSYGETDEFGYNIVKDPVHINDFHATVLHLMGLNHEKLVYKHLGRRYRLTDVAGQVVNGVLA
jgi:predicted AlkP superfamily pyrophosphatase or phosphodiesterase